MAAEICNTYRCSRCDHHTRIYARMLKHYQCIHSTESGFRITCGVDNCYCEYSSVLYLCRHMRQKHADFYAQNMTVNCLGGEHAECSDFLDIDQGEHFERGHGHL